MKNALFETLGKSSTMKVLDYLLDVDIDVTVTDICKATDLSRNTADSIIKQLAAQEIILVTRNVGKTKMLKLNDKNPIAKRLIEINNLVLRQQEQKLEEDCIACR